MAIILDGVYNKIFGVVGAVMFMMECIDVYNNFNMKYINYAKQFINSDVFRNFFVIDNGRSIDLLKNGKLSCAKFVSEVLYKFKMIKQIHVTVESAVEDMKTSAWKMVGVYDLQIGDVLVWEKNKSNHYHIGFYIGNNRAISNSEKLRSPQEHHFTYNGKRRIKWAFRYVA